ncbi:hypothetical protein [Persephonella sp.]
MKLLEISENTFINPEKVFVVRIDGKRVRFFTEESIFSGGNISTAEFPTEEDAQKFVKQFVEK